MMGPEKQVFTQIWNNSKIKSQVNTLFINKGQ